MHVIVVKASIHSSTSLRCLSFHVNTKESVKKSYLPDSSLELN